MTQNRSLADYVELAMQKHEVDSGRRLAAIAKSLGHQVSHSTLNRIRQGRYESSASTATLQAIAHLAGVSEADVFTAANDPDLSVWANYERAFDDWYDIRNQLLTSTTRYARLRGIDIATASAELEDLARQTDQWRQGHIVGWYPPWDPDSPAVRAADQAQLKSANEEQLSGPDRLRAHHENLRVKDTDEGQKEPQ